jgi:hydroxymethylbilane synthase
MPSAFGYAFYEGNFITLKAGIISLDGKQIVKVKKSAAITDGKELGKKVALEVLRGGGQEILDDIRNQDLNIA